MAAEPGRGATLVSDLLDRVRAAADLDDVLSPDLDPVEIRSQFVAGSSINLGDDLGRRERVPSRRDPVRRR